MEGVSAKSITNNETLLCIVNTCTVTQKAEQKARRIFRLLLKIYPNSVILVTGCYAQVAKEEIQSIDKRICVLGGQVKSRLSQVPIFLNNWIAENKWNPVEFSEKITNQLLSVPSKKDGFPEDSFKLSTSSFLVHSRASLKIQDGCNNSCSYCAIHIARGKSVSIDVQTAIDRVKELELSGQEEVVITTVNIAQYCGKYGDEYYNFTKLLKILLEKTQKISFRISSLYPEIVDEEFCNVIKNPRVRPHFHISVQSGSDKILKAMNRKYEAQKVVEACNLLKNAKDNPFLACDIITGFPGETKEDFAQTMELCKKCDFSWVHAFPYSERPGTAAAVMKNKVPQSESGERAKRLTDWAINQKINYINKFTGKTLNAIIETKSHAMTENFIHCEIVSDVSSFLNKEVKIKIIEPLPDRIVKGGEIEAKAEICE